MKTRLLRKITFRSLSDCRLLSALVSLGLVMPRSLAGSAEPKDHALFVGATLRVEDGKGFFEVVGMSGNSVLLLVDGKLKTLRGDAVGNVQIERKLKLSDVIAQVDHFKVAPTVMDPHADRFARNRRQIFLADLSARGADEANLAASQASDAAGAVATAVGRSETLTGAGGGIAVARGELERAETNLAAVAGGNVALQSSVGSMTVVRADQNAVAMNCALSATAVIPKVYALMVTEFADATGAKSSYKVHLEPVGDLGPKVQEVTFVQTGLPPDFVLGRVRLHLYSEAGEVATNLADRRVDLTAEDAFRYQVLSYVAAHAKETLPAKPLKIALPPDFKQLVPTTDHARDCFVIVGADGVVRGLSAAKDQQVTVDRYLEETVRKFRYYPALKDGKPLESVVRLRLADLLR